MKAQDLMIGDWVYRVDFKEPIPVRILGLEVVNYDTHPKQYVADVFCPKHNNNVGLYMDEISPIELTAEILEGNFTYDPYGAYFFGGDYIEVYIKEYTDGLWRVEVDEIEMSNLPAWRMFVSNVHELQHALRLAGINKEIKL